MHPGSVPECLQNLTQVEEMLIAQVSPIMYVYRKHGGQHSYKGHVLNLSQNIQSLLDKLPQNISNLPILILRRIGTNDAFSDFTVRRQKVLTALQWLKQHNPFYNSISIDYAMIEQLPENGVPDELLHSTNCEEPDTESVQIPSSDQCNSDSESDTDMNCTGSTVHEGENDSEQNAEHNYTSFIPVPHQEQTEMEAIYSIIQDHNTLLQWPQLSKAPSNEFTTEGLATMAFPTLFPYGTGDPTTKDREQPVSLSESFKHLISFGERRNNKFIWRFASHPRFMYWALNMKQRHHCHNLIPRLHWPGLTWPARL